MGSATVRRLLRQFCKVGIWDINQTLGSAMATELGPNAHFVQCDVSSPQSVNTALNSTLQAFSRVDVLVNCAGIIEFIPTYSKETGMHPLEAFDKMMKVNLYGTFNTCRLIARHMVKQQPREGERGVIINTSSISGTEGAKGQTAYSATKGAIIGMTLPMARDLGAFGIRVATIAPGLFLTPMSAPAPKEALDSFAGASSLGRGGDPDEFAHTVQFIIENTYVTGSVFRIDGGTRIPHTYSAS